MTQTTFADFSLNVRYNVEFTAPSTCTGLCHSSSPFSSLSPLLFYRLADQQHLYLENLEKALFAVQFSDDSPVGLSDTSGITVKTMLTFNSISSGIYVIFQQFTIVLVF